MAQTPPSAGRPGRQLIVLGLAFVLLFGLMFFSGTAGLSWTERMEPRLGLDLVGGTRVAMQAVTEEGEDPEESSLELARQIIESRVNALGVEEAEVVTEGSNQIVVSVAGAGEDRLRAVGQPAELRFRKVLERTHGFGIAPEQPDVPEQDLDLHRALGDAGGPLPEREEPAEEPEEEPEAEEEAAAEEEADQTEDTPAEWGNPEELEQAVAEKIDFETMRAALTAVENATVQGGQVTYDATVDPEVLRPFSELTGPEVSVLPTALQFYLEPIGCAQLNARPPGSIQNAAQLVVACDIDPQTGGPRKSLLDTASVLGTDVSSANATLQAGSTYWEVQLNFTGEGQGRWTELTREAVNNDQGTILDRSRLGTNVVVDEEAGQWQFGEPADGAANVYQREQGAGGAPLPLQCGPVGDQGNCLVAAVLDNEVVTAPQIRQVLTEDSRITGDFTAEESQLLESQLRFGALPLTFEPQEEQTISATLGVASLRAGLLAAAIGVFLVLLYTFFYYRLLGIVIFGSLVISSLLIYAALVVLGRSIGFTLTLAGIAGFIVAVGIAADSFVIYFERLKDEIRDGRTARSAVPRAWVRARRTIISANVVTLLAAVVLYLFSAGQVRGFAFALGLATVLDLLVVFTFRHPIMTLLSRTRAFLSPRVSGLGRALELDRARAAATGVRTREASA